MSSAAASKPDTKETDDRFLGVCSKSGCGKRLVERISKVGIWCYNRHLADTTEWIYYGGRDGNNKPTYRCCAHATKAMIQRAKKEL